MCLFNTGHLARLSWVVTATAGLLLLVALTSLLTCLLSSVFNRGSSVMPMLCLPLLLALVFSVHVWNDDVIAMRFLVFESDATSCGKEFHRYFVCGVWIVVPMVFLSLLAAKKICRHFLFINALPLVVAKKQIHCK